MLLLMLMSWLMLLTTDVVTTVFMPNGADSAKCLPVFVPVSVFVR